MRWSSQLISVIALIACVVVLCLLSVARAISRQAQRRDCEEMRRHVRRNYDSAA